MVVVYRKRALNKVSLLGRVKLITILPLPKVGIDEPSEIDVKFRENDLFHHKNQQTAEGRDCNRER